jgi:hypothetical protein
MLATLDPLSDRLLIRPAGRTQKLAGDDRDLAPLRVLAETEGVEPDGVVVLAVEVRRLDELMLDVVHPDALGDGSFNQGA